MFWFYRRIFCIEEQLKTLSLLEEFHIIYFKFCTLELKTMGEDWTSTC